MGLNSKLAVRLDAVYDTPLDLATVTMPLTIDKQVRLASGTGAGQADRIWSDTRTLAASGTENIDLAGVLTDPLTGATITFARIKKILVTAATANVNNVNVIREAANGAPIFLALGDGVPIRPGGGIALWAVDAVAYQVTPATGDLLTFTNSGAGTPVTYDITIIGSSA